MSAKRISPYERLRREFNDYADKCEYAHRAFMWRYPKEKLSERWSLTDLAERVQAAKQLGYDVILESDDKGLSVFYRKALPSRPWAIRS